MVEQKTFDAKLRSGGEVIIITFPKSIMQFEGLEIGDKLTLKVIKVNSKPVEKKDD